jgi:Uma2 family endonuclease
MSAITSIDQLDPKRRYTYADYLSWQIQERVELLRGYIRQMSPAPNDAHQRISVNLSAALKAFFKKKKCQVRHAPYDVRLAIAADTPISAQRRKSAKPLSDAEILTVVQPDVLVICDPRKIDKRGCLGAPDLVIEILSEGNNREDTGEKFSIYEAAGVPEYWIVHPAEQTVTVYTCNEKGRYVGSPPYAIGTAIQSPTLHPWELAVEEVFE